jgi:Tfp pilus assembly protein PilV
MRPLAAVLVAVVFAACTHNDYTPNVIQLNPSGTAADPAKQSISSSFTLTAEEDGYTGEFTAQTTVGKCWVVQAPITTSGAWTVAPEGVSCSTNLDTEQILVKDTKGNSAVTYIRSI